MQESLSEAAGANSFARVIAAYMGRFTFGLSPAVLILAYLDWRVHFGFAPGKQAERVENGLRKMLRFAVYGRQAAMGPNTPPCIDPLPQDRRFAASGLLAGIANANCRFYGAETVVEHYNLMGPLKAFSPGPLATRAASGIDRSGELLERGAARAPTHDLATIEDVGGVAACLVSGAATTYVDGGVHIVG